MILFLFFVLMIILSNIHCKLFEKYDRLLYFFVFCCIIIIYIIFSANSYSSTHFLPNKNLNIYFHTGNFYNWLMTSFFNLKLSLNVSPEYVNYLSNLSGEYLFDQQALSMNIKMFYDTSIYNDKIYLYFGITPILLFYIPFYLVTHYFISDHIVVLLCSVFIFVLQLLILKEILLNLIKNNILNKNINKYLNVSVLLVLSISSGILLTYISITVHLITILTSILCQLSAIYLYLSLNKSFSKPKMFFLGLCLALAVGARPISIIFLISMFVLILYSFNIKKHWRHYLYFFVPIVIYGINLAIYNYLRFDSIFNFGYIYQFSPIYQKGVVQNLNHSGIDFIKHIFLNLFHLPLFTSINPLCVFKNFEGVSYFEPMVGGLIVCPIIVFLLFFKNFFIKTFNITKNICLLFVVMLFVAAAYFLIDSYIGSNSRFVAEYLFLLLIPSLISFYFFIETTNNVAIKITLNLLFYCLVIFSLYVNINLINCIFIMSKNGMI